MSFIKQQLKRGVVGFLQGRQMHVSLIYPSKRRAFDVAWQVKREIHLVLSLLEAAQIFSSVQNTAKVPGDLAEVGVYMGGSAKIICEAKGDRQLHLFDTFEGLPDISAVDDPDFHKNQYKCSVEQVQSYLQNYSNVSFYKGLFPASSGPVTDRQFSFVHLDVDLYESTLASLGFFYSRLSKGGVLLSHDYALSKGVRSAFDEFFADKPEPVIEIAENQCLVVKS